MRPHLCRILLLLPLLVAGCVEVSVHTKLDRQGQGVQTWKFETTALMAGELRNQIETDPFFQKGKKLLEKYNEGEYSLLWEIPFKKSNELVYKSRNTDFQKKGWLRPVCTYTEVWDSSLEKDTGLFAKKLGGIVPITVKVSVEMPGRIIRSNADQVEGSTATWNLNLGSLAGSKALLVESQYFNWLLIAPIVLMILAILLSVAYAVARLIRKTTTQPCPACKTLIPSGSVFCNTCGGRL